MPVDNGNHGNVVRIFMGHPESCTANECQSRVLEQWQSTGGQKCSYLQHEGSFSTKIQCLGQHTRVIMMV